MAQYLGLELAMRALSLRVFLILLFCASAAALQATSSDNARLQDLFDRASAQAEQKHYADALKLYREALQLAPDSETLLYNGAMMSYLTGDFAGAAELWERLAKIAPDDWRVQSKLVQTYQARGDTKLRDQHRATLFDMRKRGISPELSKTEDYCREQFQAAGLSVMAFEHFEMKGDRARIYEFVVLDKEEREDYTISLGSYELTNAIWRRDNAEKAAKGERLYHLDGYFKNGHATYGFYSPQPSYDEVRERVVAILEKKANPISSTTVTPNGADVKIKK